MSDDIQAFFDEIKSQSSKAIIELLEIAKLEREDVVVVGCSSSEVSGYKIGTDSNVEIAKSIFDGIYPVLQQNGLFLAAQCCEHLNRAIIVEKEVAVKNRIEIVNAIPQIKAGGSFATVVYSNLKKPVAVESISAKAGIDIGGTLIGMHLSNVAVPVRLSISQIGKASIICARTRLKYIGGNRTKYDENF